MTWPLTSDWSVCGFVTTAPQWWRDCLYGGRECIRMVHCSCVPVSSVTLTSACARSVGAHQHGRSPVPHRRHGVSPGLLQVVTERANAPLRRHAAPLATEAQLPRSVPFIGILTPARTGESPTGLPGKDPCRMDFMTLAILKAAVSILSTDRRRDETIACPSWLVNSSAKVRFLPHPQV